jgi:hypothetical protein
MLTDASEMDTLSGSTPLRGLVLARRALSSSSYNRSPGCSASQPFLCQVGRGSAGQEGAGALTVNHQLAALSLSLAFPRFALSKGHAIETPGGRRRSESTRPPWAVLV